MMLVRVCIVAENGVWFDLCSTDSKITLPLKAKRDRPDEQGTGTVDARSYGAICVLLRVNSFWPSCKAASNIYIYFFTLKVV